VMSRIRQVQQYKGGPPGQEEVWGILGTHSTTKSIEHSPPWENSSCSATQKVRHIVGNAEVLLQHLEQPATSLFHKPDWFSIHPLSCFFKTHIILSSYLHLCIASGLSLLLIFLHVIVISPMHAWYSVNCIFLDIITLKNSTLKSNFIRYFNNRLPFSKMYKYRVFCDHLSLWLWFGNWIHGLV
jgi:hypothetical protein